MKTNTKLFFATKSVLVAGFSTLFFSSFANAWTIKTLYSEFYMSQYDPFDGSDVSIFRSDINATGATLVKGASLKDYVPESADAVIINCPGTTGYLYTQAEKNVLTKLLNSNTRVLIFGENDGWSGSNGDIAGIVGGSYTSGGAANQTVNSNPFPLITEGVSNVTFVAPGKISPNNGNGLSLTSGDSITLWGANDNFLVFMDVNAMSNGTINNTDNRQLAQNIANFLAGAGWSPIPEPSTYGLIAGFVLLGGSMIRRRR